jgi:hypothetical protein
MIEALDLPQDQADYLRTYAMERNEGARNILEGAKADGLNFAAKVDGEVYVNIAWIRVMLETMAAGFLMDKEISAVGIAEMLSDTVNAAIMDTEDLTV